MKRSNFLCPNCFKIIVRSKGDYEPSVQDLIGEFDFGEHPEENDFELNFDLIDVMCNYSNCNNKVKLIKVDEGMANIVSKLNRKGYETTSSCEGHIKDMYNYSLAYVEFKCTNETDDIFFINNIYINYFLVNHGLYIEQYFLHIQKYIFA